MYAPHSIVMKEQCSCLISIPLQNSDRDQVPAGCVQTLLAASMQAYQKLD